jgi:N6-L-threonylcarbamoyladenine synthase
LVGLSAAKGYALSWGVPFVAVNHLEGHLFAPLLEDANIEWPMLTVLVSGGHSALVWQRGPGDHEVLGETIDDAAGEAFDKVARWLGLGYPGGPVIDRLANTGDPTALSLPTSMVNEGFDLSFSGLKTAVVRQSQAHPEVTVPDVAASFQRAVAEQLLRKARQVIRSRDVRSLALAGGVAANSELRRGATALAEEYSLACHLPSLKMCTDNAAMIAAAGVHRLRVRGPSDFNTPADPNWPLEAA